MKAAIAAYDQDLEGGDLSPGSGAVGAQAHPASSAPPGAHHASSAGPGGPSTTVANAAKYTLARRT